ncbi:Na+/H+ antiporter subunit G [Lutimaribacter sp. EGI FJ00015]|uniref:Na+/H+ antiporter subunit G n=1 Tax=Lutimaribacter degradans TaxID=2945989 RepID=A0ACC6A0J5_9RHOB|nr:Na+/H+ antiporter subunit G [Lutimaribacter sp. EGI FJ00013]MCM2563817.1 Na+/H+ antiporter subunit G [Lutimaribacter sp. EGI FJ00013]MCO0615028.1 Na+/H+ antiporter subunit G [Lutimaribacter sp. EGI FJ00015]MCO0637692.1 Na+/H+ antiporter subunit G [Lutimaribacter sp. EGI FJ00014]
MELATDILISFFLVLAGIFGLVGSFGLVKLKDTMQRLHAPTKATTLGVGGVLIASMLYFLLVKGSLSFHELLITLFLFLTAPISAHFIAKTFVQARIKESDLPPTGREYGWSIHDDPPLVDDDRKPDE